MYNRINDGDFAEKMQMYLCKLFNVLLKMHILLTTF